MPGPVFQSGEIVSLHTIEEADLEVFARGRNNPAIRVPLNIDTPSNTDALEEFHEETVSGGEGVWFVVTAGGASVGAVMFTEIDESAGIAELAFWILPEHQGNGYGREAVSLLLEYGFDELRLHRVRADCFVTNEASRGLLESLGFVQEGQFREAAYTEGKHVDVLRYGLLIDEWGPQ